MSGPERSYINKVHQQIIPEWNLHKQASTGMMGANGTPDYYYEGFKSVVWIEYKYVEKLPARFDIVDPSCRFRLSALQRAWLNRANKNQVNVAVVLGSVEGALIITRGRWEEQIDTHKNRVANRIVMPSDVAFFAAGFGNNRIAI
jgi:hypothetical protein